MGGAVSSEKLGLSLDSLQAIVDDLAKSAGTLDSRDRRRFRSRIAKLGRLARQMRQQSRVAATNEEEFARLAAIVRCSDDAILSKTLDGTIRTWNTSAEQLFGYKSREIVGKSIRMIIPPERVREEDMILRRLRQGKPIKHYETVRVNKDGGAVDVSLSIFPILDDAGQIRGAAKIIRDISERKAAEAALRESEDRMHAIVQTAVDAIITIDQRGIIESANTATQRLFGYTADELIGRNVKMLMPDPYRGEHDGYLRHYLETGRAKIIGIGREVSAVRKDGSMFPMSLSVSEVARGSRRLFTGIIHDLSGRRQLERQILQASAEEQRRIGQDLHDGLCQDLIGIAFGADQIGRQLTSLDLPQAEAVNRLAASVREAASRARQLSHGLNPVDLNAGGLPVALEGLATKISESFEISCEFAWDRKARVNDDATASHLYRIAQEAISNAIKHGKAKHIRIRLENSRDKLVLTVASDGIGFPRELMELVRPPDGANGAAPSNGGIGLKGMRYRASMVGGVFDAYRGRTGGTVISCAIPVQELNRAVPTRQTIPVGE